MKGYKPDIIGMMFKAKENATEYIDRVAQKYGKCIFEKPLSENDISIWETANNIQIPEDYRAWLMFSGYTKLTGIPVELYPPLKFEVTENGVIIGHREENPIFFSSEKDQYFTLINGKCKNLGHIETIIRFWGYDVKKLFHKEDLEKLKPVIDTETEKMYLAEESAKNGGIKENLAYFFARNNIAHLKERLCYPHSPLPDKLKNCPLIISEANNEGYYQWQPMEQTEPVDFDDIENTLGFRINPEIKELVSSYYFFRLDADLDNECSMDIDGILPGTDIKKRTIDLFNDEDYSGGYDFTNGHHIFLIGTYFTNYDMTLVMDNETGEVFAVDYVEKHYKKVADSLLEIVKNMKPIWEK